MDYMVCCNNMGDVPVVGKCHVPGCKTSLHSLKEVSFTCILRIYMYYSTYSTTLSEKQAKYQLFVLSEDLCVFGE